MIKGHILAQFNLSTVSISRT